MKKLSKILNESAWGDMRRRSTGEMIRREDELNSKSPEEFVDYLKDHYVINDYRVSDIKYIPNRFINIPVALVGGREYIHTWYLTFDPDNGELTISSDLKQNAKKLWPKLIKKFKLHDNGSCAFVKDKSINNTYALEFIDFIIDNIDDNVTCCISRKTNESAWGDMRKRSTGEITRKEDTLNIKDMKPIDLGSDFPVYWADIDLEANGEDRFDWEDVQKMIPRIEKTGWRLPKGPMEIRNMFGKDIKKRNEYLHRIWDDKGPVCKGILSSDETGETLEFIADKPGFYVSISYWCESDYEPANGNRQQDTERSFDVNEYCSYEGNFSLIAGNNEVKTKRIKIRLVKDK